MEQKLKELAELVTNSHKDLSERDISRARDNENIFTIVKEMKEWRAEITESRLLHVPILLEKVKTMEGELVAEITALKLSKATNSELG
jgi:hypothetical protein